jgi:putative transcriptional regulator
MVSMRIAKILKSKGLNAHAFAKLAGVPITTAYRLARPHGQLKRIDMTTINKVCTALDCTPGDLFDYTPEKKRH